MGKLFWHATMGYMPLDSAASQAILKKVISSTVPFSRPRGPHRPRPTTEVSQCGQVANLRFRLVN